MGIVRNKFFRKVRPHQIISAVLFILLILSTFLYFREKNRLSEFTTQTSTEIEEVVSKVGKLILLPEDSKPSMATIQNVDVLRDEEPEFYENASNGDNILIYPDQVIIYNPTENIIINVAPIVNIPNDIEGNTEPEE
jgi:Mg2+/citrate symporter